MSCTIDHLHAGASVRVRRSFRDVEGRSVKAGTSGVIRQLVLDWARQQIQLHLETASGGETLRFSLAGAQGPGSGRMRDYFEVTGAVREPRAARTRAVAGGPAPMPELAEEERGASSVRTACRYVHALAARRRFTEAEAQLQEILSRPDEYGGVLTSAADALAGAAVLHRDDPEPEVYTWLRHRALQLWYAWGASATSGGEGSARSLEITAAEARLPSR